jgi:hypothetical protein
MKTGGCRSAGKSNWITHCVPDEVVDSVVVLVCHWGGVETGADESEERILYEYFGRAVSDDPAFSQPVYSSVIWLTYI